MLYFNYVLKKSQSKVHSIENVKNVYGYLNTDEKILSFLNDIEIITNDNKKIVLKCKDIKSFYLFEVKV